MERPAVGTIRPGLAEQKGYFVRRRTARCDQAVAGLIG